MLAGAGHHVEVVCGSRSRAGTNIEEGVVVHRVFTGDGGAEHFGPLAASVFEMRHRVIDGFDVVESPEANAEGAEFAAGHANVALVVKLHTPLYLSHRFSGARFGIREKARFGLGALRRGRWPSWPEEPDPRPWDYERVFTLAADRIAAPSQAITRLIGSEWHLPENRVSIFPLPFESPSELADINLPSTGRGRRILFVGRLEPRKGSPSSWSRPAVYSSKCPQRKIEVSGTSSTGADRRVVYGRFYAEGCG